MVLALSTSACCGLARRLTQLAAGWLSVQGGLTSSSWDVIFSHAHRALIGLVMLSVSPSAFLVLAYVVGLIAANKY